MKYLSTYWTILGLGDRWIAPGCSAVDKSGESEGTQESSLKTYDFIDQTRSGKTRFFKTSKDVKVAEPPAKQWKIDLRSMR
jgi:hypothetical protein